MSLQENQLTRGWSCSGLPVGSYGPRGRRRLLRLLQQLQDGVLFDDGSLPRSHKHHHLLANTTDLRLQHLHSGLVTLVWLPETTI